jgi:hypothetical protein
VGTLAAKARYPPTDGVVTIDVTLTREDWDVPHRVVRSGSESCINEGC